MTADHSPKLQDATQAARTICVYCGSRHGNRPSYTDIARAVGAGIGRRGWQLVYGGGKVGLMGEVADATLAAGGRVVGVIPESLMAREVGHAGLHELHVVPTMHVRKQKMAESADAFVVLPGGIGSMEEFFEVWTWRQLGYHRRPIALLDDSGYYAHLRRFLEHSVVEGFLDAAQLDSIWIETDAEALLTRLEHLADEALAPQLSGI
jgi:uncharacterized protein (TIGR00730 family)